MPHGKTAVTQWFVLVAALSGCGGVLVGRALALLPIRLLFEPPDPAPLIVDSLPGKDELIIKALIGVILMVVSVFVARWGMKASQERKAPE